MITRRHAVTGLVAAATGALPWPGHAQNGSEPVTRTLRAIAQARGLTFGAAAQSAHLSQDQPFAAAFAREAGVLVPEWEMKWGAIEATRGQANYARCDALMRQAAQANQQVRGHTLVWHLNMPAWLASETDGAAVWTALETHINRTCKRYAAAIPQWDVVNEAIEPKDGMPGGYRNSLFLQRLGPDYIGRAFQAARLSAPAAQLIYNDYGVDYDDGESEARRQAIVALLADLLQRGIPVDALGIQAHLMVWRRFNEARFARFLADVAGLGLKILITELDVRDRGTPTEAQERDRIIADHARTYLDVALDNKATISVATWGLSDKYTWLNGNGVARSDGLKARGLPLDVNMQRKSLWSVIARCLEGASSR